MPRLTSMLLSVLLICVSAVSTVMALDGAALEKFSQYMDMSLEELADAAARKLHEKYPGEDWSSWSFPNYVHTDKIVETSYHIAVKEPEMLGMANVAEEEKVIPCYCTCQKFGHDNLLYCFWKDGRVGGAFDEHGSQCDVCMRQAFLAFLWSELGATHEEIIAGMKTKFAPLIKMRKED